MLESQSIASKHARKCARVNKTGINSRTHPPEHLTARDLLCHGEQQKLRRKTLIKPYPDATSAAREAYRLTAAFSSVSPDAVTARDSAVR